MNGIRGIEKHKRIIRKSEHIDVDKAVIQAYSLITDKLSDLAIVNPDDDLEDVVKAILQQPKTMSAYVVDNDRKLIGVITIWDIILATVARDPDTINTGSPSILLDREFLERYVFSKKASDIMREPVCVGLASSLRRAYKLMIDNGLTELPVVDNQDRIIGDITLLELLKSSWDL